MSIGPVMSAADKFILQQLDQRLMAIEKTFAADGLTIVGSMNGPLDDYVRELVEGLKSKRPQQDNLIVLVTSFGGYIETVQRIVETLRHHYKQVSFVIPNYAFSAGTVLVMSGDDIYMDYYSRLGPIDPQVETAQGRFVPALGYLKQWDRLMEKGNKGLLNAVELQLMIAAFDQAELYKFEEARNLSVMLLERWLAAYKFKDWMVTETSRKPVTDEMRKNRAVEIAEALNNTDRWHSHGYGISMETLQEELKLRIDDLAADQTRHTEVKEYDQLLSDYLQKIGFEGIIHTVGAFRPWW